MFYASVGSLSLCAIKCLHSLVLKSAGANNCTNRHKIDMISLVGLYVPIQKKTNIEWFTNTSYLAAFVETTVNVHECTYIHIKVYADK